MEMIKRLVREEEGQGMVEYALIIALVAVALIVGIKALTTEINTVFDSAADNI